MNNRSDTANRLIHEKSPYLKQHAANPVDWYPWGPEALERARTESKPIFLSVGYSTCHWCHVMERESFEDVEIARLLNANFVSIKVDREERPDLDQIYMTAVQALTGSGGWPMTVFLTPDAKPFFGGTYFPPEDRWGRMGFRTLLEKIHAVWTKNREDVVASAEQLTALVRRASTVPRRETEGPGSAGDAASAGDAPAAGDAASAGDASSAPGGASAEDALSAVGVVMEAPGLGPLHDAYRGFAARFDQAHGGFGPAPKFPTPHNLTFLLRYAHRTGDDQARFMVTQTLDAMASGGIHDHLGGGFHRYSTDAEWLAPHFEKMLYDQAGLALAYAEAFQVARDPAYADVLRGILDYVLRDLRHPDGAFYSAEDADSEGEEGTFYVWTESEIDRVLGELAAAFKATFDVSAEGNWEGKTILRRRAPRPPLSPEVEAARRRLLEVRARRARPHRDEKILGAWNGYMIEALATAARVLGEPRYQEAAAEAARFLRERLWADGRLQRYDLDGHADVPGYVDDYAFLGCGELALYETSLDMDHLERARRIASDMLRLFRHEDSTFLMCGRDGAELLTPVVDAYDGALPSGNAAAARFLLRLGHLLGDGDLEDAGRGVLAALAPSIEQAPLAHAALLSALDFALGPFTEIVLAGRPAEVGADPAAQQMLKVVWNDYRPRAVWAYHGAEDTVRARELIPHLGVQEMVAGRVTAYVCRGYACSEPVHGAEELASRLSDINMTKEARRREHGE